MIKTTAWINAAIVALSMYSALTTEHVWFSIAAFVYSALWLLAFMWANLPNINRKPAGGTTGFRTTKAAMHGLLARFKHSTEDAV